MNETKTLKLYKYKEISARSLSIIESGKIWYPKPHKFNDPFDCGLDLSNEISIDEKIQILSTRMDLEGWPKKKITDQLQSSITLQGNLNEIAEGNIQKLTDSVHDKRNNMGVLTLSRTCKNILMWAHYADKHKGMCIEFSVPVTDELHKVTYSANVPPYTLYDIYVKRNSSIFEFFITKHKDWSYEQEYRLIWSKGNKLYDIPGPITAIIFGLNTPPEDEALIRKVAAGLDGVRFRKCMKEVGKFGVNIEEV